MMQTRKQVNIDGISDLKKQGLDSQVESLFSKAKAAIRSGGDALYKGNQITTIEELENVLGSMGIVSRF